MTEVRALPALASSAEKAAEAALRMFPHAATGDFIIICVGDKSPGNVTINVEPKHGNAA